jgi:PAS domain S-box-containing protein
MVAITSTNSFDDILLNRKGLGETGEVYLVNQNKTMISESRFIENAPFKVKVDTLPVNECFGKGTEIFNIYPDYRGIPIVGSSYCARDKGFVLLAEFDEAEIFSPITQLRNAILATAAVITAIVVINSFYVAKTISKPVTKLKDAADRISKGDYEHKVEVTSRDEVGQLALQFDNMRKSVLETNMNLNRIVRERTKELGDMTNALDATAIVAVTDKDGTITKVNRKFVEISKYSEDELIGQNHRILKSGYHQPEYFENMWKTITCGQIWEGEIKNKAKDGSYYWVKTTIVPFLDENGRPKQYIAIHNNITDLKNIEERLNEALERDRANTEIIRRNVKELQKTNLELRRKDKLKDEFLSMASHELKTPLTPILGWCGALKSNRILGSITPPQRSAVDIIEKNAIKLEKMVSDMLDVQKIELNEMKFSIGEVQVSKLLKNIEKDFQFMMSEKNIQFTVSSGANLSLQSDETRIMQVLSALLYNSVDFVPRAGGKIDVTATESSDGQNIIFCVRDNGPGIPKDKQEFLFKKFYQVDTSLTRKHGGTGLGLAISKGIVTGLGGTIWVETEEGKGSSFYFRLPKKVIIKKQNENPGN